MNSRDRSLLLDIVDSAQLALSYLEGGDLDSFETDIQRQDATIRRIQIIGEAAARLSQEARESIPQVPWHAIVGMRNLLVHQYEEVDVAIVWRTVKVELPLLLDALRPFTLGEG